MFIKEFSALATIRKKASANSTEDIIEIFDPENHEITHIKPEETSSIDNTQNLVRKISENLAHNRVKEEQYSHWISRGWEKSLEYYLASTTKNSISTCDVKRDEHAALSCKSIINNDISAQSKNIFSALMSRKTARHFSSKSVDAKRFRSILKRTSNILPEFLHFYHLVYNVENLNPGIYRTNSINGELVQITEGNYSKHMSELIQGMQTPQKAICSSIIVADMTMYSNINPARKGLRDLYIEVGRFAQKYIICLEQMGISSLVTPALSDKSAASLLRLTDINQSPMYSITFGFRD